MNELFKNITWSDYLLAIGAAVVVYYAVVLLLYFRKGLGQKLQYKHQRQVNDVPGEEKRSNGNPQELIEDLELTTQDIGHSILVPGNEATHDELLEQLKVRVANFGGLSRPGYRYALNNYIIEKAKKNCGADFSEEELEEAWDSLPR